MSPDLPNLILPAPVRQFYVHSLLVAARDTMMADVLLKTLGTIDPDELADDIKAVAPSEARKSLQAAGIRDELVFAAPSVLATRPSLLGYYRLLLGVSQKQFYTRVSGLSRFKPMEVRNSLSSRNGDVLKELCIAINDALGEMVTGIVGGIKPKDLEQLPLIALGAQFDGSWRNQVGKEATKDVFAAIKEIVKGAGSAYQESDDGRSLTLVNSSGRKITVALAADPDVVIVEDINGQSRLKVAIEIKGGTDRSNAHNRAGEAEKSHQKARNRNAGDFWTVISVAGMDMSVVRQESPTTRQWFDVTEIQARHGAGWTDLRSSVQIAMGI